jgi:hypothetical protein
VDEKKFETYVAQVVEKVGYLTEEQTGRLAAEVIGSGGVNRNVVEAFLNTLSPEDKEEFVQQVESLSEES